MNTRILFRKIFNSLVLFSSIFVLLLSTDFGITLWRQMTGFSLDLIEGDPLRRNILFVGYLIAITPLLFKPTRLLRIMIKNPLIILILTWTTISIIWTNYPEVTFRRILALFLTLLFSIALYLQFPRWSKIYVLCAVFLIIISISIVMALLIPSWGIMTGVYTGSWRGVFQHKNQLGIYSVLALLIFTYLIQVSNRVEGKIIWFVGILLSMLTIIKSNSMTAFLLSFFVLSAIILIKFAHSIKNIWKILIPFMIVLSGIGIILFLDKYQVLFDVMGRDSTLTGRIPLWKSLISYGLHKPLGFGFGSFWVGENYPSGDIWNIVGWKVLHGHNGYIDVWLQLGWIGLCLCLISVYHYTAGHYIRAIKGNEESGLWFIFLIFFVIYNISESNLLSHNSIFSILLFLSFFSLSGDTY